MKERGKLGYWYLPDEPENNGDEPAPAPRSQVSQLGGKKPSKRKTRRSLGRPPPTYDDDAYDAETSDGENDTQPRGTTVDATVRVSP